MLGRHHRSKRRQNNNELRCSDSQRISVCGIAESEINQDQSGKGHGHLVRTCDRSRCLDKRELRTVPSTERSVRLSSQGDVLAMPKPDILKRSSMLIGFSIALLAFPGYAKKAPRVELAGVSCEIPPPLHCPDANCLGPHGHRTRHCGGTENGLQILPRLSLRSES